MMSRKTTKAAALSIAVSAMLLGGSALEAQDPAARLSGTWVFNRELSTGFGAGARGRRGGGVRPSFAMSASAFAQRGGAGSSDPGDLTPQQRAEQAAMRQLQQIDERITIKAEADAVTFIDTQGERTYVVNDKSSEVFIASWPVKVKSKWDKQVLKQEFTNSQAKLVETWSVDSTDHLVLTAKVESVKLITPERKAVFDRQ